MSFLAGVTTGVAIFLTLLCFFGAIGIIVLLFFLTKHERYRYIESRFIDKDKTPKDFDQSVSRALHRLTSRSSFYLAEIEVNDVDAMETTFGAMQMASALDMLRKKASGVFPFIVEVCKYSKERIRVLITSDTNDTEIQNYFDNFLIEVKKPIVLAGALRIEVDVNVAVVNCPKAGKTAEALDENLKLSMAVSKRKGYNNVVFHTPELNSIESEQYKHYMELRQAIQNDEFELYYQKIVETATFEPYGYECLLRWNHRELGVLPPDKFLTLLEHSGDINWVGQWAFEQLVKLLYVWKKKKVRRYIMSFNLSGKQLSNPNLFENYRKIVKNFDIDPSVISLEISDYEIWNKSDVARMNLKSFREFGFLLSVDDYKAEDGNTTLLELIAPQTVKLSRSFIAKAQETAGAEDLLTELRKFTKEKGIALVACGVENEATLDFLKKHEVYYSQGYFFGRPKPVNELQL